jgi:hypothetical protein
MLAEIGSSITVKNDGFVKLWQLLDCRNILITTLCLRIILLYFKRENFVLWTRSEVFGSASFCKVFDHFLCLPKENEPKERAPVTLGPAGTLRAVQFAGSLKTRYAQTVQTP